MKLLSLSVLALFTVIPHEPLPDLAIGGTLPAADKVMMDVSGTSTSLRDLVGNNGLLVIFSCNTCPFVIGSEGSVGWEGRYPELAAISARSGVVADAFGARTTPHVFLFDKDMKLVYKGAIDDNVSDPAAVKEKWLENALNALASGAAIDPATTRNVGCSIKRIKHEH